jgi:DDE superfamily endonuclease
VQLVRRVCGTGSGHRLILFGFLSPSSKTKAVAAMRSVAHARAVGQSDTPGASDDLDWFRQEFYRSLTARGDALFELTDAVLCADGPVRSLVELTLVAEHRRGHGAMYDALAHGAVEPVRLRRAVARLGLPRADGRIVLAVDVSPWLRSDAPTSADRLFCHVYGRGRNQSQRIPGWPYSFVAALEPGRTSWTVLLDAQRLGPADDATVVTAAQLRDLVGRLREAGQHDDGDPDILVVLDAGYDVHRLAYLLADLPVQLLGRMRADRVLGLPAPPRRPGRGGRPPRHGSAFALAHPEDGPAPVLSTTTDTTRYGRAHAHAWDRLHPRLEHRGAWADHPGELPIVEGTLIRLRVDHLPGQQDPKPVWLWWSRTDPTPAEVDRCWQAFLRRFDLEHTFRLFKQTLGWTTPKIREPAAADRWTWLVIAAHTQLRLARHRTHDLRRPWERPLPPHRLTPARVRRGFRRLRAKITVPARAPKPAHPGPGRPPGSRNRRPAPHHPVGKHAQPGTNASTTSEPAG